MQKKGTPTNVKEDHRPDPRGRAGTGHRLHRQVAGNAGKQRRAPPHWRIEGACYIGTGILFLLYGYYREVNKPMMSVVLTIASLGTRVALAYLLSATPLGVTGIGLSVPIGWALADAIGIGYYLKTKTV